MHMKPWPPERSPLLPAAWQALQNQPFVQRVELDEVHSAASFLQDWDCLVVGEELAELGYLKKTTAAVPATSTYVKV